ncbi:MAG: phosphoserine phosphatase SerB [Devosia nanyangense]|uniref:Phosphoserine phosphatase n=1 Tax=Devosia nanyangense TaxID=1228055 RepID=A0A933L4F9_9HYPH|nr:phosphoserine phosphatase SerB [Devosia nanyangense]
MSVLCLIANPADPALDYALVARIHEEVGGEVNWLHQRIACEIVKPKLATAADAARGLVGGKPIDVALVALANRRKRLLIADMDSTMIEQECIDELAEAVGIKAEVAAITARAMNGELDFAAALRTRVKLLKGLPRARIEEVRREQITLAPGGRTLVQTMKAYGAFTSLVSGGFTFFADHFAKRIGFDEAMANTLEFDGDVLTGTVREPILGKEAKLSRLKTLAAFHDIPMAATLAVGDGANDLDMIKAAGLGVALHAKPVVAAEAQVRIDHGNLTALLYLQGYADEDFVR